MFVTGNVLNRCRMACGWPSLWISSSLCLPLWVYYICYIHRKIGAHINVAVTEMEGKPLLLYRCWVAVWGQVRKIYRLFCSWSFSVSFIGWLQESRLQHNFEGSTSRTLSWQSVFQERWDQWGYKQVRRVFVWGKFIKVILMSICCINIFIKNCVHSPICQFFILRRTNSFV